MPAAGTTRRSPSPANAKDQNEILDFIIKDCDAALPDLTEKSGLGDKDGAVKVTKGFANAIKGKAMLFKGDYAGAKAALKAVIDSKKYDLVDPDKMNTLYHFSGRGNDESIFEFNLVYDASVDGYYQRAQPNFKMLWGWRASRVKLPDGVGTELPSDSPWGWCNPSKKFVDTILENDGYDSARRKAWIKSYDEVLYEMPYNDDFEKDEKGKIKLDKDGKAIPRSGWTLDDKKKDDYRGVTDPAGLYGHVGYFMWKRLYRQEDKTESGEIQWNLVIMRYAEVLLMYAEACAQTNDPAGLEALNKVQRRAQSKHISSALTLDEVKKEKYIECWLEGSRFPDLVRWGDAEKELKNNGTYLPNFKDAMFSLGEAEHRGYIDDSDAGWCKVSHPEMGFNKAKQLILTTVYNNDQVQGQVRCGLPGGSPAGCARNNRPASILCSRGTAAGGPCTTCPSCGTCRRSSRPTGSGSCRTPRRNPAARCGRFLPYSTARSRGRYGNSCLVRLRSVQSGRQPLKERASSWVQCFVVGTRVGYHPGPD